VTQAHQCEQLAMFSLVSSQKRTPMYNSEAEQNQHNTHFKACCFMMCHARSEDDHAALSH